MKLPTLYRKSSTGAIQQWTIEVNEFKRECCDIAVIKTEHGQIGGKMQTSEDQISEGKNKGQKNETTALQQAEKEAKAKWELQKKKKGYVESIEAAEAGEVDALVEGGYFPMLADKFSTKGDRVEYPAYEQPKLDGYRCVTVIEGGVATLWSRTRKPIKVLPHIVSQLENLAAGNGADRLELDGELYNHEWVVKYGKERAFEMLGEYIRTKEPVDGYEQIQYNLYDYPSIDGTFEQRNDALTQLFQSVDASQIPNIIRVETNLVESEDDAILAFENFLSKGYEGAMLRTRDGEYLKHPTKRSVGLLKIKKFDDAEFEVVGVNEGRGKMAGKAVFVCQHNGETFEAKMKGPLEQLREYWANSDKYIGKQITVQYQGFTGKKKVPRFPVALRFREAE